MDGVLIRHITFVYLRYSLVRNLPVSPNSFWDSRPFENEECLDSASHKDFLEFVLSIFNKSLENVVCPIGENCATNKAVADLLQTPIVGCYSHRFNLAVGDILGDYDDVIESVYRIMVKLRNLIPAANLRKHTNLRPILNNKTRWSSTSQILRRYIVLQPFLEKLQIKELTDLLLGPKGHSDVAEVLEILTKFDSVTKFLQREDTTILQARSLFDSILADFPSTEWRLQGDADIVHSPLFESALCKIQDQRENDLTISEAVSVNMLVIDSPQATEDITGLSYVQQALKKRKVGGGSHKKYTDTRFIIPTSNLCERFFSKAGISLDDKRGRLLPSNLEEQMFLHANRSLWDISDVQSIVTKND